MPRMLFLRWQKLGICGKIESNKGTTKMRKIEELKTIIANEFASAYKAYDLNVVCKKYGIMPDEGLDPMKSKRIYVGNGLNKMQDDEIWKLARLVAKEFESKELIKEMEPFLGDSELAFSFVTRKRIIDYVSASGNMEGDMSLDEFLSIIWNMEEVIDIFTGVTVGQEIVTAVKTENSMTYRTLLSKRLEIKYLPDKMFSEFLECLVLPEVREGEGQERYVQGINAIIKEDGYELYTDTVISGAPRFRVGKKRATEVDLKNLIFAPLGQKPDIVIDNSISNELKLVGNTDNCLLYNFESNADGLLWNTLIKWWESIDEEKKIDSEMKLYHRLKESLDSDIEKVFFRTYYSYYRHPVKKDVPALVPQVFLHYDPRSKYQRNGQVVYSHQRMDFLMLLPDGVQLVFELDGQQHYSENGKAVPRLYAEMVKDDRDLRLKGYEVYRFGGFEFLNEKNSKQMIRTFFDSLFKKHSIKI